MRPLIPAPQDKRRRRAAERPDHQERAHAAARLHGDGRARGSSGGTWSWTDDERVKVRHALVKGRMAPPKSRGRREVPLNPNPRLGAARAPAAL